ncbi:hypothetical protein HOG29_00895 [bacterium]|jgi:hypothetical protein|nr:hypothetical protein [bacterium]
MKKHISNSNLLKYIKRPLGSKKDKDVEIHLAECDKCVSNLTKLDQFFILLKKETEKAKIKIA